MGGNGSKNTNGHARTSSRKSLRGGRDWNIVWKVENESIEWLEYPGSESYTVVAKVAKGKPSSFNLPSSKREFKLDKKKYSRSDVVELQVLAKQNGKVLKRSKNCLSVYMTGGSRIKKAVKDWKVEWKVENTSIQWKEYAGSETYSVFASVGKGKPSTFQVPFGQLHFKLDKSKYHPGAVIANNKQEMLAKTINTLNFII